MLSYLFIFSSTAFRSVTDINQMLCFLLEILNIPESDTANGTVVSYHHQKTRIWNKKETLRI